MGNNFALCTFQRNKLQLNAYLTPRQIHLVQETLDIIRDDLTKLGLIVFVRFFERNPSMKKLFPKIVRVNEDNELELAMDNEMLTQHAMNVMHSLVAAVESLDESDMFNSVLAHIGKSHVNRKIKPRMILKLWPALDYGLRNMLPVEYTKEVATAWKKVFYFMVHQMKAGMGDKETYIRYGTYPSGII